VGERRDDDLGTLGGAVSFATGINGRAKSVGFSYTNPGSTTPWTPSNMPLVENGAMTDLARSAADSVFAAGINNGAKSLAPPIPPLVYPCLLCGERKMTDLGTLGGRNSSASAINRAGPNHGYSDIDTVSTHAVLWENGKMTDLGTFAAENCPQWINERGQVVGFYSNGTGGPAALFSPHPSPTSAHAWRFGKEEATSLARGCGAGTTGDQFIVTRARKDASP